MKNILKISVLCIILATFVFTFTTYSFAVEGEVYDLNYLNNLAASGNQDQSSNNGAASTNGGSNENAATEIQEIDETDSDEPTTITPAGSSTNTSTTGSSTTTNGSTTTTSGSSTTTSGSTTTTTESSSTTKTDTVKTVTDDSKLPQTGEKENIIIAGVSALMLAILAIVAYKKVKKYTI